jgi:RNA polymerase sigma factor (sigma-70 family)
MDEELINRCISKEPLAQKQLFELYYGKMMAVCMRYIKNEEDSRDVLNVAFEKVFRFIDKYNGDGVFDAWIRRIFVNTALDFLKKKIKAKDLIVLEQDDMPDAATESNIVHKLDLKDIYKLMDQLPPLRRLIFNMHVVDGYAHQEIGEMLNLSINTSKWHVAKARQFMIKRYLFTHNEILKANEQ